MRSNKLCVGFLGLLIVFVGGYFLGTTKLIFPKKPTTKSGTLVILNGASSAGKSSLAKYLIEHLPPAYLNIEGDLFYQLLNRKYIQVDQDNPVSDPSLIQGFGYVKLDEDTPAFLHTGPVIERLYDGMLATLRVLALTGNNIIFNFALTQEILAKMVELYSDIEQVYLIGVYAPIETLTEREQKRKDRPQGLAAMQIDEVHAHGKYDFTVDTSLLSTQEAGDQIIEFLASGTKPHAFDDLQGHVYRLKKKWADEAAQS